jgi:L-alanine-DL-glutamate epimerase-like enolase superfamily enzyme
MGSPNEMKQQIEEKLNAGFRCLKMKIGAIDFQQEYNILKKLRSTFSPKDLELRVDANGAFSASEAPSILEKLAELNIHSIEQPIKAGQWQEMAQICESTPLPVALDEELIGIDEPARKEQLLQTIRPQYIILKPSLTGGFKASEEWISAAENNNTGWWVTSALESNIGLNAIAQWTATLNNPMPQGLGTGQVFSNNTKSSLTIKIGELWMKK